MTEVERIIQKGIIKPSFLEEETRCDFFIDKGRKKLWAVLLDILLEIDRVCKKNNLTYFLCDGTLLGAVRHKGFIPWDDDIDIAMPRKDYEKLLDLAMEFKYPYLLQTPYTEKDYFISFAKVRNVNTTFASEMLMYNNFNQGGFVDIFPFDTFNLGNADELFEQVKLLARCLGTAMKLNNPSFVNTDEEIGEMLSKNTPLELYEKLQTIVKSAGIAKGDKISTIVSTITRYAKKAYPVECTSSTIQLQFEDYIFPVPVGYKKMLEIYFGDYMQFPPIEKRGDWHTGFLIDMDTPYEDYKKDYLLKKNEIK